jgi:hypothetical protein
LVKKFSSRPKFFLTEFLPPGLQPAKFSPNSYPIPKVKNPKTFEAAAVFFQQHGFFPALVF